jgi:hypothetical protein
MTYFLSWYEKTDLNTLRFVREGSKWTLDPAFTRQRQELAHCYVDYAQTDEFMLDIRQPVKDANAANAEGFDSSQDEDEAEDGGDAEAEAPVQVSSLASGRTTAPSAGSGTPAADTSTGTALDVDGSAFAPAF